MLKVEQTK